jgi:hypothetical protein
MIIPKAQIARLLQRAGGLCEGMKEGKPCKAPLGWRSGIHHNPPSKMGGTTKVYRDEELVVVCGKCHSNAHGLREAE